MLYKITLTTLALRKKLSDFLQTADDKKVKAVYALLEHEIKMSEIVSVEDYNKEINEALVKADNGNYISQAQMEKQAARW